MAFQLPDNLVHVMCHYHRQWIPGDQRGFRSRGHRIHSTGDYRQPPPADEHQGLRSHVKRTMAGRPVRLRREQREGVGAAFVEKLRRMDCTVLILCCGPTHLHALAGLTERDMKRQIGKAKQFASLRRSGHAGQLWGGRCEIEAVTDAAYARKVFAYIRNHESKENAWIWRFDRDGLPRAQ
jgi:REP element-mobilizing transposase RayT